MKAAGVEYEQRIAELEELEWPKPNRDFIYETFNAFADRAPLGRPGEHPAQVGRARDVRRASPASTTTCASYGLRTQRGRAAALPVAGLQDAWPRRCRWPARSEEVMDILAHFRTLLRDVDTSLIEEWESLTRPGRPRAGKAAARPAPSIRWPSAARCTPPSAPSCTSWCARSRAATTRRRCARSRPARWRTVDGRTADGGDGAVLGRARRAADHAGRAPARSHAHRRAGRRAACAFSRRWSMRRATRTGRSTASSTRQSAGGPPAIQLQRIGI